jgi:hypothetical protein
MTATTDKIRPAPAIFDLDEQEERREIKRRSQHSNRLEGIEPNPEHDFIREAFIRGDVDADGAIAMLRAHRPRLNWSRWTRTGGRDPPEQVVAITGMGRVVARTGPIRSVIPVQSDQWFQSNPISCSGQSDQSG